MHNIMSFIKLDFIKNNSFFFFKKKTLFINNDLYNYIFYSSVELSYFIPFDIYCFLNFKKSKNCKYSTFFFYKNGFFLKVLNVGMSFKSTENLWVCNQWYEREISDFTNVTFFNSTDTRSLLLPYSYVNNNSVLSDKLKSFYSVKYNPKVRDISFNKRFDTIL
jgi:hypothetical protein